MRRFLSEALPFNCRSSFPVFRSRHSSLATRHSPLPFLSPFPSMICENGLDNLDIPAVIYLVIVGKKPDQCHPLPSSPAHLPLPIFEFRLSNFGIWPLSPFLATLTRNQRFCRKTPPVSPLFATLTDTPSRKSFPCHSYENMGGVPPLVPPSASRRPRNPLTPLESALTDSSSRKSFRIRSYEKHRGEGGLPPTRPTAAPFGSNP